MASVPNRPLAVRVGIQIVWVFICLHEAVTSQRDLRRRREALEKKYGGHDVHIETRISNGYTATQGQGSSEA